MTEDLTRSLARIASYSAGLKSVVDAAQASAPARGRGTDRTGVVSAVIGADGLPRSFRVNQSWPGRLRPENLGKAVAEACQDAVHDRLVTWSKRLKSRAGEKKPTTCAPTRRRTRSKNPDPPRIPDRSTPSPRT